MSVATCQCRCCQRHQEYMKSDMFSLDISLGTQSIIESLNKTITRQKKEIELLEKSNDLVSELRMYNNGPDGKQGLMVRDRGDVNDIIKLARKIKIEINKLREG